MKPHALTVEEVVKEQGVSEKGLSKQEAEQRLEKYGKNEIREKEQTSLVVIFLKQFKSFLIFLLIFAAIISALVGHAIDAIFIAAIIFLNAVLGFTQEYRAEKAVRALKKIAAPKATVMRNGKEKVISSNKIVPGDIIVLKQGDEVPADARLISEFNLSVNEASLTGESEPQSKQTKKMDEDTPLPDRKNMIYAGTTVTKGRGRAVVTETGMETKFGEIAEDIQSVTEQETPLQKRLSTLGTKLGIAVMAIAAVIVVAGVLTGKPLLRMALTGIALAVAAVPEGLPAVITMTLAIGMKEMAKDNAVVRKLLAVETLGSTTVICSDKTGTLTKNDMELVESFVPGPEDQLFRTVALCNDTSPEAETGDMTERALSKAAKEKGFTKEGMGLERTDEVSFSSERKIMTTMHEDGSSHTKGAPEVVLSKCTKILTEDGVKKLDEKQEFLDKAEEMASEGQRVLAAAYKEDKGDEPEQEMIFLGLTGLMDPLRPEAKEAVAKCEEAGIRPIVITGDHALTAKAIAKKAGIETEGVIEGEEVEELSDDELKEALETVSVFARVSPSHKLRIVELLEEEREVVAVTGDGVNDAPALKKASIGVAMGITGTDVSKGAAEMILTDDNFATIVKAVKRGRIIFSNIRSFVSYLLSANAGEILVLFTASVAGLARLPLLPIHLLWVNLVTDGLPALALGVSPAEKGIMERKPRSRDEPVINKEVAALIVLIGIVITVLILTLFLTASPEKGTTMAFTSLVVSELFFAFSCQSMKEPATAARFKDKYLFMSVIGSLVLQAIVVYTPVIQQAFGTVPLGIFDWFKVFGAGLIVFTAAEVFKKVYTSRGV